MSRHLSLRSGNPALNSSTFNIGAVQNETMTIKGTVDKTAMSLFLLIGTGYFTFGQVSTSLIFLCGIGGFVVALITIFKKEWAPITVPIYAILEGGLLGGISYMYTYMRFLQVNLLQV